MRTKGSLSRDEAIAIVGRNTVEAVGHVKRQFTGAELDKEGLVEFVASIEAVDTDVSPLLYPVLLPAHGCNRGFRGGPG